LEEEDKGAPPPVPLLERKMRMGPMPTVRRRVEAEGCTAEEKEEEKGS
jgi:hypothetical protein